MNRQALLFLLLLAIPLPGGASPGTDQPPNIILVITDDQGYGDLGCHGNPHIRTPALDRFKSESVSFTNFHVSTTCAPTRGSLMTGRHSNRLNVFHTIAGRSLLFEDEVILPHILSKNGYACGMFGKWHLGDNYPFRPEDRGFGEVVRHGGGGISQMPDYWGNDYFDDTYWHNGRPKPYDGYCTDVFFREAIRFIREHRESPFFCYLSTNAPHGPYNLPASYLEMYEGNDALSEKEKRFYGMISNIDDNFAGLLETLRELGLSDNTLVIFMTDNGTAAGHGVFNAGMRGHKGSEYDGGHRVPLMMRWPEGGLEGGREVDRLAAHFDLLPTLLDLLEIPFSPARPLDGTSLKPLLSGAGEPWPGRILYVDTQRLQNLVKYRKYSVMDDRWRLVNGTELYDVTRDPGQQENLIRQHPEVADRLSGEYERWWESIQSEGPNERHAYIRAGTPHENPVRICSHDLMTGFHGMIWHQNGAIRAEQAAGKWKVEIAGPGRYTVALRRFPRESGLAINASFPAGEGKIELEEPRPATRDVSFTEADLVLAGFRGSTVIGPETEEAVFQMELEAGMYDMEARLTDRTGRVYPAYYVYIQKH